MSEINKAEMRLFIAAKFMSRTLTQPEDSRGAAVDVRGWTEAELRELATDALNAADVLMFMAGSAKDQREAEVKP